MIYTFDSAIMKNGVPGKPLEDHLIVGKNAVVVADGVTRDAEEYAGGCEKSHAAVAAELTARHVLERIENAPDPSRAAREAALAAIRAVAEYNAPRALPFPAAAVYVSGALRGNTLHFAYVGDSVIELVRDGVRIRLSEPQTAHLRALGGRKGMGITKRQMYDSITNEIHAPGGYGVIDGDMRALDFVRASSIDLRPGDRLIFASDGLDAYLSYGPIGMITFLSAAEMIEGAVKFDSPPYNGYPDDKAVVVVDCHPGEQADKED